MNKHYILILTLLLSASFAFGQTIWDGPDMTFTKADNADYTLSANQDSITSNVIITRASSGSIFNIAQENSASNNSPVDTEWAIGTTADINSLTFSSFRSITSGGGGSIQLNHPMVLHLITDDIFIDVQFTSWTSGQNGGGFEYVRSTQPTTGISEEQNKEIALFPNPASDFIRIEGMDKSARVFIHDVTGRRVIDIDEYKGEKIDLLNLEPGIYFVKIDNLSPMKIIKS
ncbi:MAG: T9SS type A sorting domain-containing protein [Bacteroidales bacterium]|nr:T9SS type A sorting domain-containing protein [Bacteroidales bacterium]